MLTLDRKLTGNCDEAAIHQQICLCTDTALKATNHFKILKLTRTLPVATRFRLLLRMC